MRLIPILLCATLSGPPPAEVGDGWVGARVRAAREIAVAAQVSGVVVRRPVPRNSFVKAGDVLLEIDPTFVKLGVAKAEAALAKARADAAWAALELEREEKLATSDSTNRAMVDRMRAGAEAARALVASQRAILDEANERLARCRVRAPEDGLLAEIHPEVGEAVTLLTPVAQLLTTQDLVAEAFLRGDEIVRFRKGAKVRVAVTEPPIGEMVGVVREIARAAGPMRSFRLVVALADPPKGLLAGFDARIALPKGP